MESIDLSQQVDASTLASASNIYIATGHYANAAALQVALRTNLITNSAISPGDGFLVAYGDGANSYLALATTNTATADDASINDLTLVNIKQGKGVTDPLLFSGSLGSYFQNQDQYDSQLFIDGIAIDGMNPSWQIGDQANVHGLHTGTDPLHLGILWSQASDSEGNPQPGNPDPWKGGMDEFKIWSRALTDDEIYSNYLGLNSVDKNELLLHYDFDDPQSGLIEDKSGNGNDGNIFGNIQFLEQGENIRIDPPIDSPQEIKGIKGAYAYFSGQYDSESYEFIRVDD